MEEEFLGALYKGGELLASGKVTEAREHLEKAHGLAPKNEKAQNLLGLTYFKLGLFEQASDVYEKLVNENPTDATLRVNLGLVYLKTNNLERCIKEFETATDLEPEHKKAHNYLGLALAQQGQYAKAKEHFELAGSDQMAEKMGRALAAQSAPSGLHQVPPKAPVNVVLGEEPPPPVEAKKPPPEEETIEVMSDEEAPSDAYTVPEEAPLASDWGSQLPAAEPPQVVEERFPEDSAPMEELPVLDAVVESAPPPARETPAWLTMEAAEASRAEPPQESAAQWVTESVSGVPLPPEDSLSLQSGERAGERGPDAAATDATWSNEPPAAPAADDAAYASYASGASSEPVADDTSWATAESAPASPAADDSSWATGHSEAPAPASDDASWATGQSEAAAPVADDASWATGQSEAAAPVADDASWATGQSEAAAPVAGDASWATGQSEATAHDASWATGQSEAAAPVADDASWATGQSEAAAPVADDASWATGQSEAAAPVADDASWATGQSEAAAPVADDASWATGQSEAAADASYTSGSSTEAVADDASWATGQPAAPTSDDAAYTSGQSTEPAADEASWATGQPAADDASWATGAASASTEVPAPAPSAPISITVEEPPPSAPRPSAPIPASVAPEAPAGYAPMRPQRLVDLGASGAWVHEPSAGPFHLSSDGLAVTVAGEMLVRMVGLVAIVGSIEVTPENKRRRGRSSQEPFGTGAAQLQRVKGNGMLYLEPGRSKFHAVDLADQNGVNIDDDGAYLREELVFAFEEAISFDNGKLTSDGQSLELAHLKGNGRVLLQLDGTLRAMPIPLGAPMVVPLQRIVGWFGRVTPRLMGFGGRGAIELTGEGYALLGTPAEGR